MATVPNTATLPHQQLQNMIWENCPRVQIFCFLCSQMVSSVFAFMELQKCPLWHGATAGPSKQGWEHPLSSYRIQETAFGEPFCAHPMEARGPLPHFQSAFVLLQSNSPGQSLAMTPHTAPAWFKWRNYFFLSHQPCHYSERAALYNICQSCSAFLLCSQSTATGMCWYLPETFQACKYLVNALKKRAVSS